MKTFILPFNRIFIIFLFSGLRVGFGQSFDQAREQITGFVQGATTFLNVIIGVFCLYCMVQIAIAYFGGGEDQRQNVGSHVKRLIYGVIAYIIMFTVVDGIFNTEFGG